MAGSPQGRSLNSIGFFSFRESAFDRGVRISLGLGSYLAQNRDDCPISMQRMVGLFFQRNGRSGPQRTQWNSNTFVNALGAYRSVVDH